MSLNLKGRSEADFLDKLVENILRLAEEQPEFIYNSSGNRNGSCYYTKGHTIGPECDGCIIGQALQRMGYSKRELEQYEDKSIISVLNLDISPLTSNIQLVQDRQDAGCTWETATSLLKEFVSK